MSMWFAMEKKRNGAWHPFFDRVVKSLKSIRHSLCFFCDVQSWSSNRMEWRSPSKITQLYFGLKLCGERLLKALRNHQEPLQGILDHWFWHWHWFFLLDTALIERTKIFRAFSVSVHCLCELTQKIRTKTNDKGNDISQLIIIRICLILPYFSFVDGSINEKFRNIESHYCAIQIVYWAKSHFQGVWGGTYDKIEKMMIIYPWAFNMICYRNRFCYLSNWWVPSSDSNPQNCRFIILAASSSSNK